MAASTLYRGISSVQQMTPKLLHTGFITLNKIGHVRGMSQLGYAPSYTEPTTQIGF